MSGFQKAQKTQAKLRMALIGPSGSGKTMSALKIAQGLGQRIALIDTEHGSASKYAGDVAEFDTMQLSDYHPDKFIQGIQDAARAGYDVLIIDSLSHAWTGAGGVLEQVDQIAARNRGGSSFNAWRDGSKLHNALINAILAAPMHVICTMRAKTEYVQEKDDRGKTQIKKLGLAPVQRDGMEYEFDVVGDVDIEHRLIVTKSRYAPLADRVIDRPGSELGSELGAWLGSGVPDARLVRAVATCQELQDTLTDSGHGEAVLEAAKASPQWKTDITQATAFYKALRAMKDASAA